MKQFLRSWLRIALVFGAGWYMAALFNMIRADQPQLPLTPLIILWVFACIGSVLAANGLLWLCALARDIYVCRHTIILWLAGK